MTNICGLWLLKCGKKISQPSLYRGNWEWLRHLRIHLIDASTRQRRNCKFCPWSKSISGDVSQDPITWSAEYQWNHESRACHSTFSESVEGLATALRNLRPWNKTISTTGRLASEAFQLGFQPQAYVKKQGWPWMTRLKKIVGNQKKRIGKPGIIQKPKGLLRKPKSQSRKTKHAHSPRHRNAFSLISLSGYRFKLRTGFAWRILCASIRHSGHRGWRG